MGWAGTAPILTEVPRTRCWIGAALVGAIAWGSLGGPASALPRRATTTTSAPTTTTTLATAGPPSPAPTTTTVPAIQLKNADASYLDGVSVRLHAAEAALGAAQATRRSATATATAAAAAAATATAQVAALSAAEQAAIALVRQTRIRLRDLAVSAYLAGGPASPINALLTARSADDFGNRQELVSSLARTDSAALHKYDAARQSTSIRALHALAALRAAQDAARTADQALAEATDLVALRTADVSGTAQLLQLVTAAVSYPGTDIPRLVLDAYRRAAAAVQQKGCVLPWAALAGIGKVESDHGRAEGAEMTITGDLAPAILGPVLDGNGNALVADTDHGRLDGDPFNQYETAVGPMQFLPATWMKLGRDGNGDGVADPNNIYDAALTAAVYLCRDARPDQLNTDPALRQAFFAYNHSDLYADEVLALTHIYMGVSLAS